MALLTLDMLPATACPPLPDPIGPGRLAGTLNDKEVQFPLQGLHVEARLTGPVASVDVRQTFGNPYADPIEAVYIFPLPAGSAVYRFRMQVKDRIVDGVVQERAQARATYAQGIAEGHRSALMEMERDNVFTVQVGNLPPGETVSIELSYAQRMDVVSAETIFRFPLVVAPRYIPGDDLSRMPVGHGTSHDTSRVPDASRITPPVLLPGLKTGASLSIKVVVETGGLLPQKLACSQHATTQSASGGDLAIELARQDELLDRDFILHYRLATDETRPVLLASDRHFLLSILPPASMPQATVGRDVAIVLDRSGSMQGAKMQSARTAVVKFLSTLKPQDRFCLLAFDDRVEGFVGGTWQPASQLAQAAGWLSGVDARGGTEILSALTTALNLPLDAKRPSCMLLITDGQVGNESEMYRTVQQRQSPLRIFTLGIDTAVNDAFLRRLATLGRGTCELVTPGDALESSIDRLARETGTPVVASITVNDKGLGIVPQTLTPDQVPDLYAARPVFVLGQHGAGGGLSLTGRLVNEDMREWSVTVEPVRTTNPALGVLWARERVTGLEDLLRLGQAADRQAIEKQILALSLEYQILTRFTAFVLVDRAEKIERAEDARTVVQPVQAPAQWDMLAAPAPAAPAPMAASAPVMQSRMAGRARDSGLQKKGGDKPLLGASIRPAGAPPPPPADVFSSVPAPPAARGGQGSTDLGPPRMAFESEDLSFAPPPSWEPAAPSTPPLPKAVMPPSNRPAAVSPRDAAEAFSQRWLALRNGTLPLPADALQQLEKLVALLRADPAHRALAADGETMLLAVRTGAADTMARIEAWLGKVRAALGMPPLEAWWSSTI